METNEKTKDSMFTKIENYGVTKKTVFSMVSILACLSLIIVLSLTQAMFNPEKFKTIQYWVNLALLVGICIYSMITGKQIGDDTARNNVKGSFRAALKKYSIVYKVIDSLGIFAYMDDWLALLRAKKIKKKIENYLMDNGIYQYEVLDLDRTELRNLQEPYKKVWKDTPFEEKYAMRGVKETIFVSYSDEQIDIIEDVMNGCVKVSPLPRSFFCSVYNQSSKDIWESAANSDKKKGLFLSLNYTYRIFALLAMQAVLTGLDMGMGNDASAKEVWFNMIARISTMTMSVMWGIYIGYEIVKIDIVYLEFKIDILSQYSDEFQKGLFKPKTLEERAIEEYDAKLLINKIEKPSNGTKIIPFGDTKIILKGDDSSGKKGVLE